MIQQQTLTIKRKGPSKAIKTASCLTMDLRESDSEPMLSDVFKKLELTS